jgi:hypothetical protein
MGEVDALAGDLHDAVAFRDRERAARFGDHSLENRDGRDCERRNGCERLLHRLIERA